MISPKKRKLIFVETFIVVLLIYFFAYLVNLSLDDYRNDFLDEKIQQTSINFNSYHSMNLFLEEDEKSLNCNLTREYSLGSYKNIKELGKDLGNIGPLFSNENINKSNEIMRRYFLEELQIYNLILKYNQKCEDKIIPVLYFYNSKSSQIDKQGLILEQVALNNKNKTLIFSFDYFYDKEPILELLKKKYNVYKFPFVIVGNVTHNYIGSSGILDLNAISVQILKQRGELNIS